MLKSLIGPLMAIWLQYLEQPLEIIANLLSSFYDASTVLTWISDGSATVGFVKVSVILKMKGACCSLRAAAGCFPPPRTLESCHLPFFKSLSPGAPRRG